ncbi:MAG TPA: KEOPS complex subunit Pcc1 [Candidatus Bathyarchaeia archaeon]|nr:KEOPS complex subunit Pcc1 [Candidatus Bathyarchaeia archaeon]
MLTQQKSQASKRKSHKQRPRRIHSPPVAKSSSIIHSAAELTVEIDLPNAKIAETVYASLLPESQPTPGYRSTIRLRQMGRVLWLQIKARDIVSLRAASNSFLRLVAVAVKTINVVARFNSEDIVR